jgi:hypothetical protein
MVPKIVTTSLGYFVRAALANINSEFLRNDNFICALYFLNFKNYEGIDIKLCSKKETMK